MPGFEIFGEEERKEVQDVLDTGVLFRYGFDQARKGHWKAKTFESELADRIGVGYCHLCSSGTAALMEIAGAYAALPQAPRRSVLFLAVTAEEQGLLGSLYYAANPLFPLADTVGGINMDGMNNFGSTRDITVIGLGMSDLDRDRLESMINKPYGMILSTGPTGSGKSTSLYSILKKINQPDINIITVEDPVE